jgi:hypothetical protein
MQLNYFNNDFASRENIILINPVTSELFNGNIASWTQRYNYNALNNVNLINPLSNTKIQNQFTDNFRYDILNRIKRSQGTGLDFTNYSYDPNGNITELVRSSNTLAPNTYDNLTYNYTNPVMFPTTDGSSLKM